MKRIYKRIFQILSSTFIQVSFLIILQLVVLFLIIYFVSFLSTWIYLMLTIASGVVLFHVIYKKSNDAFKLSWAVILLAFPLVGAISYYLFAERKIPKQLENLALRSTVARQKHLDDNLDVLEKLKHENYDVYKTANYIYQNSGFGIFNNSKVTYLGSGEEKFKILFEKLKEAKKSILLEYFIIEQGEIWDEILRILIEKQKQQVAIYIMYDDFGCLEKLPKNYDQYLRSLGFNVCVFNPIRPHLNVKMNNRNHRKLAIIDGIYAFTGGINLADEYANKKLRFGHWRDSSVLIEGEAVFSFTYVYLYFYNFLMKQNIDIQSFKTREFEIYHQGFIQPFTSSPVDDEPIFRNVHLHMINYAKKYIYIQTPYLIIDQTMENALALAAKSGVNVKIMIPHIPDKKIVFELTRDTACRLLSKGIEIYEYLPGFVHAKTMLVDDSSALIGTCNMDYRSYYINYECGVYVYKSEMCQQLKKDFLANIEKSQFVSMEEYYPKKMLTKIYRGFLRLFAPLL